MAAEFYISCNPPLTPRGVEEIVTSAKEHLHDDIIEILYEPDFPWFKIITLNSCQDSVTEWIQDALTVVGEEDVTATDPDADGDEYRNPHGNRTDVDVPEDDARMIPWTTHEDPDSGADFIAGFEQYRYPSCMNSPHKRVWRGLDDTFIKTIDDLFARGSRSWIKSEVPSSLQQFEKISGCSILTGVRQNMLFIDSPNGEMALEKAVRQLDAMVNVICCTDNTSTHVIAAQANKHKLAYRWLSHVGLAEKTIIPPEVPSTSPEHEALTHGATLRTATESSDGTWILDMTSYPLKGARRPELRKKFSVFESYTYIPKTSSPDAIYLYEATATTHSSEASHLEAQENSSSRQVNPSDEQAVTSWMEGVHKANPKDVPKWNIEGMRSSGSRETSHKSQSEKAKAQELLSFESTNHERPLAPLVSVDGLPSLESSSQLPSVGSSMVRLKPMSNKSVKSQPQTPLCSPPDLLGSVSPQDFPEGNHILTPRQPAKSDNTAEVSTRASLLQQKFNLLDSTEPIPQIPGFDVMAHTEPDLMDFTEEPARFGIKNNVKKEIHRTMNQKAGRKKKSPFKTSLSQGGKGSDEPVDPLPHRNLNNTFAQVAKGKVGQSNTVQSRDRDNTDHVEDFRYLLGEMVPRVKDAAAMLQAVPGKVSLKSKLGRIYFKDLSDANVNIRGDAPFWSIEDVLNDLNSKGSVYSAMENMGFQGILSTAGEDADRLIRMRASGEPAWVFLMKEVTYEFTCNLPDGSPFKIAVDADSFDYTWHGCEEEIASVFVHWPQNAWGVKICASRAQMASSLPEACRNFADNLVAGLAISRTSPGGIVMELPQQKKPGVSIGEVNIRHIARYRSKASSSNSLLDIIMTRPLASIQRGVQLPRRQRLAIFQDVGSLKASSPQNKSIEDIPSEWFEASISSSSSTKVFEQNTTLEFGQKAQWDVDTLAAEGMFEDICRPALGMIPRMDDIGIVNVNRQGQTVRATSGDTSDSQSSYVFW